MASQNRNQQKARRRLARVRLADKKALPDVKFTERGNLKRADRYKILAAVRELNAKQRTARDKARENNYDPRAPLFGKDMKRELDSAERSEFGEQEREQGEAEKAQERQTGLVGSAYDQLRQAYNDATARINANNQAAAQATQDRVDAAFTQDKAAQEARDAAEAAKQKQFGFTPNAQTEGARAVEAARSQGNQAAAGIRSQGVADNTFMETRGVNSIQAKAEALDKQESRRKELEGKRRELVAQKGAFRTNHRARLREGEREWAAIQQEFGLKERAQKFEEKNAASDSRTQRIVAKLYSDASKEKARATIRVAKLQLEKGKIDQKQYREIVNIYKGLPKKGTPGAPAGSKDKGKGGGGSGPGGSLAPWEVDARDRAQNGFKTNKYGPKDKDRAISKAVAAGIPRRLAVQAWNRYVKSVLPKTTPAPSPDSQG